MAEERGPGDELGDSDILKMTLQDQDGARVQLSALIPPTNRRFESEWLDSDQLNAGLLSSWCNHVRDQINIDATKAKPAPSHEGGGAEGPDYRPEPEPTPPVDIEEFVRQQWKLAKAAAAKALRNREAADKWAHKTRDEVLKLEKMAAALGLDLPTDEEQER